MSVNDDVADHSHSLATSQMIANVGQETPIHSDCLAALGYEAGDMLRRDQRKQLERAKQGFDLETNRTLDLERERIREDAAKAVKEDYRIKDLEGENRTGELKKRMTCKAPSAVTFARGDPAMIEWPKAQVRRLLPSNESQPGIASALAFRFRLTRGLLFLTGPVQTHRNPGDKTLIIRQAILVDDHTLGGDFIFADIVAMVATAHFYNDHDLAKLPVDGHVPKPDNVISKK